MKIKPLLPFLAPAACAAALLGWRWAVFAPEVRAQREARRPLQELERETLRLREAVSEAEAADLGRRAGALAAALPQTPETLAPALGRWSRRFAAERWEGAFTPGAAEPGEGWAPARLQLRPAAGNDRPWPSLLVILDEFSAPEAHMGLTRLAIRADEGGTYSAEASLRLACAVPLREKSAQ
ncbi:MAG TPA: hypothetical protein VHC86_04420 [Opitutaceae bacterium]|nr:hypothetical protein [Opitutaceae bacterium]